MLCQLRLDDFATKIQPTTNEKRHVETCLCGSLSLGRSEGRSNARRFLNSSSSSSGRSVDSAEAGVRGAEAGRGWLAAVATSVEASGDFGLRFGFGPDDERAGEASSASAAA